MGFCSFPIFWNSVPSKKYYLITFSASANSAFFSFFLSFWGLCWTRESRRFFVFLFGFRSQNLSFWTFSVANCWGFLWGGGFDFPWLRLLRFPLMPTKWTQNLRLNLNSVCRSWLTCSQSWILWRRSFSLHHILPIMIMAFRALISSHQPNFWSALSPLLMRISWTVEG